VAGATLNVAQYLKCNPKGMACDIVPTMMGRWATALALVKMGALPWVTSEH
jgi:hypothetical protein